VRRTRRIRLDCLCESQSALGWEIVHLLVESIAVRLFHCIVAFYSADAIQRLLPNQSRPGQRLWHFNLMIFEKGRPTSSSRYKNSCDRFATLSE